MTMHNQPQELPSCRPTEPGTCSQCTLAYDCQRRAGTGSPIHWPLITLAVVALVGLVAKVF